MKIARIIKTPDGTPAVTAGEVLTSGILRRLSMGGVTSVIVQGNAVPDYGMGYNVARRLERTPYLFRNFKNDDAMMKFSYFLMRFFAERQST